MHDLWTPRKDHYNDRFSLIETLFTHKIYTAHLVYDFVIEAKY